VEYLWPPHVPCLCTSVPRVLSRVCSSHILWYVFEFCWPYATPLYSTLLRMQDLSPFKDTLYVAEFHLTWYHPISRLTHHVPHFGTLWHTAYGTAKSGAGQVGFYLASELQFQLLEIVSVVSFCSSSKGLVFYRVSWRNVTEYVSSAILSLHFFLTHFVSSWPNSPQWARASSLSKLHDHTQTHHAR
jgi:hypothetical protein